MAGDGPRRAQGRARRSRRHGVVSLLAVRRALPALVALVAALVAAGPAQARTVTRTGTLLAIDGHRAADRASRHRLLLDDGKLLLDARAIGGAGRYAQSLGGRRVRASGTLRGRVLRLRSLRPTGPAPARARAAQALSGAKTVLVVPFQVSGGKAPDLTPTAIQNGIFGATGSLSAYLSEQTNGNVTLSGEVLPYQTVAPRAGVDPMTACDDRDWLDKAEAAAVAAGRSPASYDRVVYVSADLPGCDFAGQAPVSSQPQGKGTWLHLNDDVSVRVSSHEWGHTYGLMHAASTRCTANGATVALSSTCSDTEYGDPFDPMGSATAPRWYQAYNRVSLGLLPLASGTQTIAASGRYTVGALAQSTTTPRLLRIGRGDGSALGIELRRTSGAFETFTGAALDGVTLRVLPTQFRCCREPLTRLIDAHPATPTFADAPLRAGESFTDPADGVTVSVVSTEADRATLDVTFPPVVAPPVPGSDGPATTTPPAAPSTPAETTPTATTPPTTPVKPPTTPTAGPATTPAGALAARVVKRRSRALQVRVDPGCACPVSISLLDGTKLLAKRTRTGAGVVLLTARRPVRGATLVVKQGARTLRKRV